PSNCGQYASRPIPKTPTRARGADRASRPARSMSVPDWVIGGGSSRGGPRLEGELPDVLLVERRQRPEHDLVVRADRVLAEAAGGERLARLAGDPPGLERRRRLAGEVPDVLGHPELELVDRAVLHELAHLVGEAEAGQLDLALLRRLRQVARGRGD